MFHYRLYGENIAIDQSLMAEEIDRVSGQSALNYEPLRIQVGAGCQPGPFKYRVPFTGDTIRDVILSTDRAPEASGPGQQWNFFVPGVVTFAWTTGQRELIYWQDQSSSSSLFSFWLVHICLPLYFAQETRKSVLHAVAVEIADRAYVFTAPSFGGKSTLGRYFMSRGLPMLADDKVAITEAGTEYLALPAHPFYRPERQVETLGIRMPLPCSRALPVAALYVLQAGAPDSDVEVTALPGTLAFQTLLDAHLYAFDFQKEQRMRWLAGFVRDVPMFCLNRPWSLLRQAETFDRVLAHAAGLQPSGLNAETLSSTVSG